MSGGQFDHRKSAIAKHQAVVHRPRFRLRHGEDMVQNFQVDPVVIAAETRLLYPFQFIGGEQFLRRPT